MRAEETNRILWVDVETTGLTPGQDVMLEVAMIVTDAKFNELGARSRVIGHNVAALRIDPFVAEMHSKNGLLFECAQTYKTTYDVEESFRRWLFETTELYGFVPSDLETPFVLAGNSVWFDRAFMLAEWPALAHNFYHRQIDVSSFKITHEMCYGVVWPKGDSNHRALDDVHASIAEAKTYRETLAPRLL